MPPADHAIADAYDGLRASGAIGSLKRDILLDASIGIHHLAKILKWFADRGGEVTAPGCAARLVGELVTADYCRLAAWGQDRASAVAVAMTEAELRALMAGWAGLEAPPLDHFLMSTERGDRWVTAYLALLADLD